MGIEVERVQEPLRRLRKALRKLSDDPTPDEVHRLRTLTRRVEAISSAWEPGEAKLLRRLLDSIRPVRKAAGRVRDMDVLAANAPSLVHGSGSGSLARLAENLRSARRAYANALLRATNRQRKAACESLDEFSRRARAAFGRGKADAGKAEGALRSAAVRLAIELGRWPALNESNLHDFRIAAKRLRAILQLFVDSDAGLVEALGKANARIGDWHDWQHLKEIAEGIPGEPLDRALMTQIGRMVRSRLRLAMAACNALRKRYLHGAPRRAA
jgi:CHAD domain-containing protein